LVQSFISYGECSRIGLLLDEARAQNVPPNSITYETIVRALCLKGLPDLGKQFHWEMIGEGFAPSEQCLGFIMKAYSDKKQPEQAENFLHELVASSSATCRQPTRACYQILLTSYTICTQPLEAERVYREMKSKEMPIERHVYSILITGYVRAGYVTEGEKIFREMLFEQGPPSPSSTFINPTPTSSNSRETKTAMYNLLLKGYLADYAIDDMLRIFQEMRSHHSVQEGSVGWVDGAPNEESYRLLTIYYTRVAQPEKAEEIILEMQNEPKSCGTLAH
jgi:pentatricopeptide repeat protein